MMENHILRNCKFTNTHQMSLEHCSDAIPVNTKVADYVKVQNSTTFLKKMKNVAILVYPLLQIPSNQIMITSLQN